MNPQPDLARICGETLSRIDGWLGDDDRALLRARALETVPTLYGELLRRLPHGDLDRTESAWLPLVKALGHLRHNIDTERLDEVAKRAAFQRTAGFLLGAGGYSEVRMSRLLTGRGIRLPQTVENALDFLVAKRVGSCRLGDLAVLAVADAVADRTAHAWARRRIAMDYARGVDATEANAGKSAA